MIVATATCAAAATEAAAQDRTRVLNNQLQLGDVIAGERLNVVDATEQVTVSNAAQGNSVSGAAQGVDIELQSQQSLHGDVRGTTDMSFGGDTDGVVNVTTQARGNYLAAAGYGANVHVESDQTVGATSVQATNTLDDDQARLLGGAYVNSTAIANTAALGGEGARVEGVLIQNSGATVRAHNYAATQYIPAEAEFTAQALANAVAVNSESDSDSGSSQNLVARQRSTGAIVEADVSANAGNAWQLAARANAGGNQAVLANQGGSQLVTTDQSNLSAIRAAAIATSYDYGSITAHARGAANEASIGNNDVYVEIDNAQFNSGGVSVTADVTATNGYDAYVGADAAGNVVTGYACADCEATMLATNSQVNEGDVSAQARTEIRGSNRAVITGANAVGNSATFYVSRPGQ